GQRKGLGIAFGKPMFVVSIDVEKNLVILGEEGKVFSNALIADDVNYISIDSLNLEMKVTAKIRYSAKEAEATVIPLPDGKVKVEFVVPQRAITPGQSVVFYQGDVVVGGAVIQGKI
ncbi:MAG: tRNA (5-methylaminomethyl-2-thiouridylate)-methyltransferase, partial [Clostridiales bacterium]|nr:tRNA (5-methylaminomethyl-2-thiouridylate)-methyltransferase [Clostridiales bacterium]